MKHFAKSHLTENQWRFMTGALMAVFKLFQNALRLIGIAAFVRKPDYHYVPDHFGRAAHKQEDIKTLPLFGELAADVVTNRRSSLYYDRLFTIYQLMLQLKSLVNHGQEINMAEVGVYKGGTSYFIASLAGRLGLVATHHAFDTFEGHASQDIDRSVDASHHPDTFTDTSFESVRVYLSRFENVRVHKGRFQETCHLLQDVRMQFVHLDMDIYEPTIFALKFFDGRLAEGGVILLDDYGFETCPGIEKAAAEFMAARSNYFGMPLLTGQYVIIKIRK